ncbi:MAG: DEAD/DEAH box helicase [Patescibacteria group bacterium]
MYTTQQRRVRPHASRGAYAQRGGGNRRSYSSNRRGGRQRTMPTFDPTRFINTNPTEAVEEVYTPQHAFADFVIDDKLKRALEEMQIKTPSPIQDQAIPAILDGKDIVGVAETGTGKTAAFLIPLIERRKHNHRGTTLILTPTRELAIQIDSELRLLSKYFRYFSTVCVGGTSIGPQIRGLRRTNQFIIGTPGRIKDLQSRGLIPVDRIDSVVLDEADRMLDMGFIHDMRAILSELTDNRQNLFFSATMDRKTKELIGDFMKNPITISVKKKDVTDSIAQDVVRFGRDAKYDVLVDLLKQDDFSRVIIFGAMKHSVENLSNQLCDSGIKAESIHGNKNHTQRQRSLKRFKAGDSRVLVATDVAARGIHVDNVSHVINYDLPSTFEDYVHRIGRTGRGAERGQALTFVAE